MAEAYLKRRSRDRGVTAFSELAFFGMKRHTQYKYRKRGCACDKTEGGACVSSKITAVSETSKSTTVLLRNPE